MTDTTPVSDAALSTDNSGPATASNTVDVSMGSIDDTAPSIVATVMETTESLSASVDLHSMGDLNKMDDSAASHDQSHDLGVIQRTMVEVYLEMVVCRKITTQQIDVGTGKILHSAFTTERDPPAFMDIHKVETTEDVATDIIQSVKVIDKGISSTARGYSDVASTAGKTAGTFISLVNPLLHTVNNSSGSMQKGVKPVSIGQQAVVTVGKAGDAMPLIKQENGSVTLSTVVSDLDSSMHTAPDHSEDAQNVGGLEKDGEENGQTPPVMVRRRGRPPKGAASVKVKRESIITTRRQAASVTPTTPSSTGEASSDWSPNSASESVIKRRGSGLPARAIKKPRKFDNADDDDDADDDEGKAAGDRVEGSVDNLQLSEGREITEEEKALVEDMISDSTHACSTCGKQFSSITSCARHMERRMCGPPQTCTLCPKVFSTERALERHMQGHRDEDDSGSYKCGDCKRCYATRGGYMKHKRQGTCYKRDELNEDGTVGDFRCGLCDTRFKTDNLLKLHISKSHEPQDSKFECKDCGRVFYSKQGFGKHESARSCTQPLRCLVCGKTYSNKARESFKVHMKHHVAEAEGIQFQCEDCGRTYLTQEALRKHKLKHSDVRPHKCPTCHKSFAMRYMVREHMRTHSGDKPFLCSLCGAAFGNRGHLYRHIRSHDMGTLHKRGRPRKNGPILLKIAAKSKPGGEGVEELIMSDSSISVLEMKADPGHSLHDTTQSVISGPTYITVQTADGEVMVDGEISQSDGHGGLTESQLQHVVMQTEGMTEPMVIQVIRDFAGGATVYQQVEETQAAVVSVGHQVVEQTVVTSSQSTPQRHIVLTAPRSQQVVQSEATQALYRPT